MITICLTFFKSLSLMNLRAALYSVRQQDLSHVAEIVIVDNNSVESVFDIQAAIDELHFPRPVRLIHVKHDDPTRTHSWSTNVAVHEVQTPWVLFTRADYLLSFDLVKRFVECVELTPNWNGFVTGNGCHLANDVADCERTNWRSSGPQIFHGAEFDYTLIDAGVWMARKDAFDAVGGLDERLTAWGHAQTYFQWKMHKSGVEFLRIPEVMFWHPHHGGDRDIDLAHRQLRDHGIDLREMWARNGWSPYA